MKLLFFLFKNKSLKKKKILFGTSAHIEHIEHAQTKIKRGKKKKGNGKTKKFFFFNFPIIITNNVENSTKNDE